MHLHINGLNTSHKHASFVCLHRFAFGAHCIGQVSLKYQVNSQLGQSHSTIWDKLRSNFITYCVPNLELDLLPLYVDHPGPELYPDGEVVDWLEPLVCELEQEAGLANPLVPNDDILQ